MRVKHGFLMMSLVAFSLLGLSNEWTAASPDKQVTTRIANEEGQLSWAIDYAKQACVTSSPLGIVVKPPLGPLEVVETKTRNVNETVDLVWGKFKTITNHYVESRVRLREKAAPNRSLWVAVRTYDSGVAVRYEFPRDGNWPKSIAMTGDKTVFTFAEDPVAWCYNGEHDPRGGTPLSTFKNARPPLTLQGKNHCMAVLEAAIEKACPFSIGKSGPTGVTISMPGSTLAPGDSTSWRVLLLGKQPGDLLTSPMMIGLNPPCKIDDTSWIKPGLAMWDWRAWGAKVPDGFVYNLDMASWRRFIDFASKNNVRYLLLDANWYGHEFDKKSNPVKSRTYMIKQPDSNSPKLVSVPAPKDWKDPIDVPALIRYGKERNVGVVLYFNDVARLNWPFEETLATYEKWGAAGIKYGFMRGKNQQKVLDTRTIVEACAKHHLICDFHDGPVPPSGDRRTWPNYLTREFCHSQSDATRSFGPRGFCTTVFVNMLAGPLDMCNGLYTLENPAKERPKIFRNVDTTVAAETARVLIVFNGMSILPDCPEAYEAKKDIFEFISALPMNWDETRILHGKIGHYITTARRNGKEWFIGSATNEEARTLPIMLDFLEPGVTYTAKLYEDAPDTHYKTNREAYRVREVTVKKGDVINAVMAPGGGHSVHLFPQKK